MKKEDREANGRAGHEWLQSEEAQMTSQHMCLNVIDAIEDTFVKFTPRPSFEVFKVEPERSKKITHKLTGY